MHRDRKELFGKSSWDNAYIIFCCVMYKECGVNRVGMEPRPVHLFIYQPDFLLFLLLLYLTIPKIIKPTIDKPPKKVI